jgi:hypothetical protein
LVLSVAAVAAAGCGSGSKNTTSAKAPPSTSTAATGANSLVALTPTFTKFRDAASATKSNPRDPTKWEAEAAAAKRVQQALDGLKLPGSVTGSQHKLASDYGELASAANKVAEALNKGDAAAVRAAAKGVAVAEIKTRGDITTFFKAAKAAGVPGA